MPSTTRTRTVSASAKAGGKIITVQASSPVNMEADKPKRRARLVVQGENNLRKPTTSNVNEDILAMGTSIIAVEAPNLRVFDLTIGFGANVVQPKSTAFQILQNVLDDKVGIVYETVTLVIQDSSLPLAEVSDPSKEPMADIPVLWGSGSESNFEYADPDSVPTGLCQAARLAGQRFVESLNGLVDIHSLALHEKPVNRLVYSI